MKLPAIFKPALEVEPPAPAAPEPTGPKGLYLGWGTDGRVFAQPQAQVLVLGPPRSGKTSCLIAPALLCHDGPAVVTSTKPDVLALTRETRSHLGRLWLWDPSGTLPPVEGAHELRWSPVVGCELWDQAVARAHALASAARPSPAAHDAHWVERAQALLAPLFHAAALSGGDLASVLSWLHRRELVRPLAVLTEMCAARAADLLTGVARTDGRELSGIFSTADSILAAYRTDAAMGAARSPNFDPATFVGTNDTVYLCAPASSQALHAPLVVALLDQVRTAVYRTRFWPPMFFALDEVAQIAPLADLPATIAEGGSQNLVVMACLQDLSQARARWGAAADGFLTLFTEKVVLPGIADIDTLKAVSALAGEVDVPTLSVTTAWFSPTGPSRTWSPRRLPVLPVDGVANGLPGHAILISGTTIGCVGMLPVRL